MVSDKYPILSFTSPQEWNKWLEKNHDSIPGVWLRFYKKSSGIDSLIYAQALEEALCYGWIDSQAKTYDDKSYLQKFTPRRSKSIWSQVNTNHIERLIKEGRMKPAGMKVVEEAKKDGRWSDAYSAPSKTTIPDDFLALVNKNKEAKSFFETLNKTNLYAIAWRLQTAKKPATREKRMKDIITMLSEKKKFH